MGVDLWKTTEQMKTDTNWLVISDIMDLNL